MFLKRLAHTGTAFFVALSSLFVCVFSFAQGSSVAGTTTFVFDGNRMYAELGFVRPDGSIHRALAFVDMGSPSMTLTESLFKELQLDQNHPLRFRVGNLLVEVPRAEVITEPGEPYSIGPDLKVEGMLPAGILQRYQVVIDYQKRILAFTQSRSAKPPGVSVPFHINQNTGLIAVDASIAGKSYPITIDNGSAYTWFRQSTAKSWLVSHPEWERGVGAVGASNMMMSGDVTETAGILLRIPRNLLRVVADLERCWRSRCRTRRQHSRKSRSVRLVLAEECYSGDWLDRRQCAQTVSSNDRLPYTDDVLAEAGRSRF